MHPATALDFPVHGELPKRRLAMGLLLSLAAHALLLALQFGVPGGIGNVSRLFVRLAPPPPAVVSPEAPSSPELAEARAVPAVAPPVPLGDGMRLLDPVRPAPAAPVVKPRQRVPARRQVTGTGRQPRDTLTERVIAEESNTTPTFSIPQPEPAAAVAQAGDVPAVPQGPEQGSEIIAGKELVDDAAAIERRRLDEEKAQLALERARREQQLAAQAREQEARQKQAAEELRVLEQQRAAREEQARLAQQRDDEMRRQREAEEQSRLAQQRQAEQEQAQRAQQREEELRRQRQSEDQARLAQQRDEELRQRRADEDARLVRQRDEEMRQRRAEEEARLARQREDELRQRQAEAEARLARQREEVLRQQRENQELAARQRADEERRQAALRQRAVEQIAAEELAQRQAAQRQADEAAARQQAQRLARQEAEGPGSATQGAGNPGAAGAGNGVVPRKLLGSDLANRAREMMRGLDVLDGPAPSVRAGEPEPQRARRLVSTGAEHDVPLRMYIDGFRQKIERNGILNGAQLRGDRVRIDPVVSVAVRSDGSVEDVMIVRSSGHSELDAAVRRIVRLNARYAVFPPNVAARYDVIEIRRIWTFAEGLRLLEEVR